MEHSEVHTLLIDTYFNDFPGDAAEVLSKLPQEGVIKYFKDQPAERVSKIITRMNPDITAGILEAAEPDVFQRLVERLDVFLASRLISRFASGNIANRLSLLSGAKSNQIRELLTYPSDCAGFIMDPRVTTFKSDTRVSEALARIRALKYRNIYQVFLVDDEGHLADTVPLQRIAVADPDDPLSSLVEKPRISINALAPREEVVRLIESKKLINLPVVDINNHLLGVIRNDALIDAALSDVSEDVQALFGAGREERALSKVSLAVRKRLPWLQINLATAFLAASVVALFEDTIARITVLAVFLPVVAGQSGNTGSQALAVTMRGLALREIGIGQWFIVARKEILVGVINGIAVAITTSIIVFFWASSPGLAAVIGIAMILSMAIAGLSGALIPMILQSLGQDPASSSSIILTTVTDIVGFLSFLGLATALAAVFGIV